MKAAAILFIDTVHKKDISYKAIVDFQETIKTVNNNVGGEVSFSVYHLDFVRYHYVLHALHELPAEDAFDMTLLNLNLSLRGCKILFKNDIGVSFISLQRIEGWLPKVWQRYEASALMTNNDLQNVIDQTEARVVQQLRAEYQAWYKENMLFHLGTKLEDMGLRIVHEVGNKPITEDELEELVDTIPGFPEFAE